MTAPHQSLPAGISDWLGVGAYEIGGADSNFGQEVDENFVNALVKIPLATFSNMFEVLEEVLLKLPIEILEAFKPFIPDWLEDEVLDVAEAVIKILASFDIRQIPLFLQQLLDILGVGDLLEGNNLFTNLQAFLDPLGLFTSDVGSFNLLTAAQHFITEVLDPTGLLATLSSILEAFGLPALGTTTDLSTWVQDLLGLLGLPSGLGTGSPSIPGLPTIPLLGSVQEIVDGFFETLTGVSQSNTTILDMLTALSSIPAHIVQGVGGPSTIGDSFQAIIDNWVSGLVGFFDVGANLSDLFNIGQSVSSNATLGAFSWDVLGIRANKPLWAGLLPTGVSNIPLPGLTSISAPTFALTQSTATMDYHRIDEGSSKGVVSWIGSGIASITHFFINIFKVDPVTGLHTLVHASPNIAGDVSASLASNVYTLTDGLGNSTPIAVLPGEVYGIEKSIRGAGTHNIVGAASWMNFDHPTVFPKRMASVRNSGTSAPPSTIAAGSVTYSPNIAFTEFAVAGGLDGHAPDLRQFLTAGTTAVVIPTWASYAEVVAVGRGGDGAKGSGLLYGSNGRGGAKGVWATGLWQRGTHFSPGDTISIVVAGPGSPASAATVNGNTVLGAGGADGSGTGTPTYGESPGNISYGTPAITYAGGARQNTLGADGAAPGGGGAGGAYFPIVGKDGGEGAQGAVFIRFRQGDSKVVSPTKATLTLTGGTPTVTSSKIVQPSPAALTITGGQPNIINTVSTAQPSGASLAITGGQPTIYTYAPIIIEPTAPSLTFTGGTPAVAAGAPTFQAIGGGTGPDTTSVAAPTSWSWSHTASGSSRAVILAVVVFSETVKLTSQILGRSATYGGVAMTELASSSVASTLGGSNQHHLFVYGLLNPATGAQTVQLSITGGGTYGAAGNTASYNGVSSFGTAEIAWGTGAGTTISHTGVVSATGHRVANAIAVNNASTNVASYNQTSRFNLARATKSTAVLLGDAAGAATVSFTADRDSTVSWRSIAVDLIP